MDIQNSKDSKDHISVDISDIKESSTEGNNPSDKDGRKNFKIMIIIYFIVYFFYFLIY